LARRIRRVEAIVWPAALKRRWHAAARAAWPREHYGILLGRRIDATSAAVIEEIWSPPDVAEHATDAWIAPRAEWMAEAAHIAEDEGWRVLGDIHTHPYREHEYSHMLPPDRTMSEGDVRYWAEGALVGITVVWSYCGRLRASTWFCRAPGEVAMMELRNARISAKR